MLKRKRTNTDLTMAQLNAQLEATGELPPETWRQWLWQTNPEEELSPLVLLNKSHLLGLLLCRQRAMREESQSTAASPQHNDDRMRLMVKPPAEMTLTELGDTLANVLIEWPRFLSRLTQNPHAEENTRAVVALVDGCFARLGALARQPGTAESLNDVRSTEDAPAGGVRITRPALRRMLSSFLVLYRHIDAHRRAVRVPAEPFDCGLKKHHMEASTDDFHLLCMFLQLPAAARLTYKLDFPGMYNHISQVVYFHNAQYERSPRIPLAQTAEGDPAQVLPAIMQLHPDIPLHHEEDDIDLSARTGKWLWWVVSGRVYLVGPDAAMYHSDNVTALLGVYKRGSPGV